VVPQASVERRLPRGVLSVAGLNDVAHDAFVNRGGIDARACHGFAHHHRAEFGRFEIFEGAEELASGGADRGEDDGFAHVSGRPVRRGRTQVDSRHLIIAEHVLQLLEHRRTHRIDFPDPPPVHGTDGEHAILQLDGRGPRNRLADRQLPREVRPRLRRRLPPDDLGKDGR
jgi:hypothetical protein